MVFLPARCPGAGGAAGPNAALGGFPPLGSLSSGLGLGPLPLLQSKMAASSYRGVSKLGSKWIARIGEGRKVRLIGCYPSAKEAAQAFAQEWQRLGRRWPGEAHDGEEAHRRCQPP